MALSKSEEFVNLFWVLAEPEDAKRIEAVLDIINKLKSSGRQSPSKNDHRNDLLYTCGRLVRGLASERKSARLGFFLALTQTLQNFNAITAQDALDFGEKHLKPQEKNEKRNCLIGEGLLHAAIVRSGTKLTTEQINQITQQVIAMGSRKFYLEIFSSDILANLLERVDDEEFSEGVFPSCKENLSCGWENATPFNVWLTLITARLFPEIIGKVFLKSKWGGRLFNKKNFTQLGQIITKSTSAHPKIHPVCLEILLAAKENKNFAHFWTVVIDEKLVPLGKEKLYLSFELAKFIIPQLTTADHVKTVLKPNLIRQFIQNLSHSELPLHNAAVKFADFLISFVSTCEDCSVQCVIVQQLLTKPGTILFDVITKTKTVSKLMSQLKIDALENITTFLMDYITGINTEEVIDVDNNRAAAAKQLEFLCKFKASLKNWRWKRRVTQFLVLHSFFDVKNVNNNLLKDFSVPKPISAELHNSLCACLIRVLNQITTQTFSYWKPSSDELFDAYYEAVDLCNNILKDPKCAKPIPVFDEKVLKLWNRMWEMVKQLQVKSQNETDQKVATRNKIFETFFLQLMIQMFINPKAIKSLVKEVEICCLKATQCGDVIEDEDAPHWSHVLVDIILSFVSKMECNTFHHITESMFHLLAPYLNVEAVQQILNVISPEYSEDDILMEEEDEEEMELDDEGIEEDEEDKEESSSNEESESSSDESMSSEDEDLTATHSDKALDNAVENALGAVADESDVDLDDVDESELSRVDKALANVFRNKKKSKLQGEINLRDFRLRCLNLLNIIVGVYPTVPVVCSMVAPICEVMTEFAYKNQDLRVLYTKAETLLRRIINQRDFKQPIDSDEVDFMDIWQRIINMAGKITNPLLTQNMADGVALLIRCLRKGLSTLKPEEKADKMEDLINSYKSLMSRFFTDRNCHLHLTFLSTFFVRNLDLAEKFVNDLMDYATNGEIRLFRKNQALHMLTSIFNHPEVVRDWKINQWNEFHEKLDNCLKTNIEKMNDQPVKASFAISLFKFYWTGYLKYKKAVGKPFELISKDVLSPLYTKLPKETLKILWKIDNERKQNSIVEIDDKGLSSSKKRKRNKKIAQSDVLTESTETAEVNNEQSPVTTNCTEDKTKSTSKKRKRNRKLSGNTLTDESAEHIEVANEHQQETTDETISPSKRRKKNKKKPDSEQENEIAEETIDDYNDKHEDHPLENLSSTLDLLSEEPEEETANEEQKTEENTLYENELTENGDDSTGSLVMETDRESLDSANMSGVNPEVNKTASPITKETMLTSPNSREKCNQNSEDSKVIIPSQQADLESPKRAKEKQASNQSGFSPISQKTPEMDVSRNNCDTTLINDDECIKTPTKKQSPRLQSPIQTKSPNLGELNLLNGNGISIPNSKNEQELLPVVVLSDIVLEMERKITTSEEIEEVSSEKSGYVSLVETTPIPESQSKTLKVSPIKEKSVGPTRRKLPITSGQEGQSESCAGSDDKPFSPKILRSARKKLTQIKKKESINSEVESNFSNAETDSSDPYHFTDESTTTSPKLLRSARKKLAKITENEIADKFDVEESFKTNGCRRSSRFRSASESSSVDLNCNLRRSTRIRKTPK